MGYTNKKLGVVRKRGDMLNLNDIWDTCRLHRKALGMSKASFNQELRTDRIPELIAALLRFNPSLKGEDLMDRHAETLGVDDDRYGHELIAIYLGMVMSPIIASTILKLVSKDLEKIFSFVEAEQFDAEDSLLNLTELGEIRLLQLKESKNLYLTPKERKTLDGFYAKYGAEVSLIKVLKEEHSVLQDAHPNSVYRKLYGKTEISELEAKRKPFTAKKKISKNRYNNTFKALLDK